MKKLFWASSLLCFFSAHGADIVWTNLSGGTWATAANWSPNQVPTIGDTAWITNNGTYSVTVSATAAANNLVLGGTSGTQTLNHTVGQLSLGNGGSSSANGTYALAGGTLTGSGTLTLAGPFNWSAGTLGSTASNLTVMANGGLAISGATAKGFNGGSLVNGGSGTFTATGQVSLNAPAVFSNSPSATFDLQADGNAFILSTGSPLVVNAGTLRKTAGTGVSTISTLFNSAGLVDIQTGTLSLAGGGTNSGQFTVSAGGATLRFGGGTHALQDTSSIGGPGTVSVTSGTVNMLGGVAIAALSDTGGAFNFNTANTAYVTNLTLSGGILTASNTVVVPGPFAWTSGTFGSAGSPGILALNGGAAVSNTLTKSFNGGTIVNNAGATWTAGQISCVSSALFSNAPSATFDMQADGTVLAVSAGNPLFANAGTVLKSAGTGTSTIGTPFNNSGLVQVQSGILALTDGGTNSGPFTTVSGTTLNFGVGTYLLQSSSSVSGPGNLWVSSGTVNAQGAVMVNWLTNSGGTLNFSQSGTVYPTNVTVSGGTLTGSNTAAVAGSFTWSSGSLGSAGSPFTLLANGTMTLSGTSKTLNGATLVNGNAGAWTAGQIGFNGGVFSNAPSATFDLQADGTALLANSLSPVFLNAGTLRKTAGTGTSTITLPCANSGSVQINSGTLALTLTDSTGGFTPAAGATLIVSGTATLSAAASISGTGNFESAGIAITNHGTLNIGGTNTFSAGATRLDGTCIINNAPVIVSGANVLFSGSGNLSPSSLNLSGGILQGTMQMTVSGPTTWTGGTFGSATSGLILFANGTLTLNGGVKTLAGGTFVNGGAGAWIVGQLSLNGGVLSNAPSATLDLQADGGAFVQNSGSPLLANAGTLRKTAGTGTSTITVPCANSGSVQINTGTLVLTPADSSGSFTPGAGAKLTINGGLATLSGTASITGAGDFEIASGTITNHGTLNIGGTNTFSGGTARFDGTCTINNAPLVISGTANVFFSGSGNLSPSLLNFTGGTLQGSMPITVSGATTWSAGTFGSAGSSLILFANGGLTLSGTTKTVNGGTFVNGGAGVWTVGQINCGGGVFSNAPAGVLDLQGSGSAIVLNGGTPLLANSGTISKSVAAGTVTVSVPCANFGSVLVNTGALTMTLTDGTGSLTPAAGTTLTVSGTATLSAAASINGAGNFEITSGSVTNHGTLNIGGTNTFSGGTARFDGTCIITNTPLIISGANVSFSGGGTLTPSSLNISVGALQGSMPVTVPGPTTWTGGNIGAAGSTLVLSANGGLTITGNNGKTLGGGTLVNNGAGTWTNGNVVCLSTAVFSNSASATMDLLQDGNAFVISGGTPLLANDGTLRKIAGTGTSFISVLCNNSGTIQANTGILSFASYTQNGGQTILNGGNFSFVQTAQFLGGSLSGNGTVTGSISNNATVSPGASPGLMTITGNYTEGPNSHLEIELGGTTAGVTYDQLSVGGTAKLAGTLDVSYFSGFVPSPGNVFTSLVCNARSGGFSVIQAPTNTLGTVYTAKSVLLELGNVSPTARLAINPTQIVCHTFLITASGTDPDGTVTNLSLLQDTNVLVSVAGGSAQLTYSSDFPGDLTFTAIATDNKGASGVTNITVNLSTLPTLMLDGAGFQTNRSFKLCMTGEAGTNYEIQASTNLAGTNWIVLGTMQNTNGIWRFSDATATNSSRVYRARQLP
jgi:hypothetical protein